ncbi:MAG: aldehyde dehydrogenase family protein [Geminicoccaceae bacterium]
MQPISPVDGRVYIEQALAGEQEIAAALAKASRAAPSSVPCMAERTALLRRAVDLLLAERGPGSARDHLADRPADRAEPRRAARSSRRARAACWASPSSARRCRDRGQGGFTRFIRREPIGLVLVVAPWNYPY